MEAQLTINLLGSPAVLRDQQPVRGFVSAKSAALVYYLASSGRAHTRATLAGLLWPEVSDSQAARNLRDVLSNLRRLLDPYLQITRQEVALASEVQVDVQRFEQLLAAGGDLAAAVALYEGDFLEGFYIAEAEAFEQWMLVERERLRQRVQNALYTLTERAGEHGAYLEGVDYATRLLALEPWREDAHRQLMRLLALSGQRGAALAQYESCRNVLQAELGIEPAPETTALYEQIRAGTLASTPPRPLHSIPAAPTALVGREGEINALLARLRNPTYRLVSLVGPGGVGKTSLALYVAAQLAEANRAGQLFAHGICFVPLAGIEAHTSNELAAQTVAARVAEALQLVFAGTVPPRQQLAQHLRERSLLLILDNFEHLLPAAALLTDLLRQAPGLRLLVTSRGRLQLADEQIVELEGLAVPEAADMQHGEQHASVQLFRRVAEAAHPRLAWNHETAHAAAEVCRLVNGLPLGVELAASLTRLVPCAEIAREITANLGFLHSARRDAPDRHQSLRAVFASSWELLGEAERSALARLSVFRGGFSRAAAERVAQASLPLLAALADNSLLRLAETPTARYSLLELVRQFAAEQLALHPDEQVAVNARHRDYYLALVQRHTADLRGARQRAALETLRAEIDNIRAAWRAALASHDVAALDLAAEGLFLMYELWSGFQEGEQLFGHAAAALTGATDGAEQRVWGKLLARQGWFLFHLGQQAEAQQLLEQSEQLLRSQGQPADLLFCLNYLAAVRNYRGAYEQARKLAVESLALSEALDDRYNTAIAHTLLGQIAYLVGDYAEARSRALSSLVIDRSMGHGWGAAHALLSLGNVAYAQGEYAEARRRYQECLAIREGLRDLRGTAVCLSHLGDAAAALGDAGEAERCYRASVSLFDQLGHQWGAATARVRMGHHQLAHGHTTDARRCFQSALQAAWDTRSNPRALEALAGLATLLAHQQPDQALRLALLVRHHPMATRESANRAAALLVQLKPPTTPIAPSASELDTVVVDMLDFGSGSTVSG